MKILVLGGTGSTGRLVVKQLLDREYQVVAIVRNPKKLSELSDNRNLTIITSGISDLSIKDLVKYVSGCDGVISCLGHNLNWKGIYGKPRKLVTNATRNLCLAIEKNKPEKPVKYILMNTAGNSNRDLKEPISFSQKIIMGLIRLLLPPHVDNERASDFLRIGIGQKNRFVEWVAVRPDNLIDEKQVTEYDTYASPVRSALFNAGETSLINVGHFMAELISDETLWNSWKGKMPVIYNTSSL